MKIPIFSRVTLFPLLLCSTLAWYREINEDRLQAFYDRIRESDVRYCEDKTKLLPDCKECIPGLKESTKGGSCDSFIPASMDIRREIGKLTHERYGGTIKANRPFGLYPYLELPDFMMRQEYFGKVLTKLNAKNIVDVGAYYNPVHLFVEKSHCPESVVVIEPILDALSVNVPCGGKYTHVAILPITFRFYMTIKAKFQRPDTIVCIGCDSHYGPNRRMLETTFARPFTLLFEYPSEYVHNGPYKKMGTAPGENMTLASKFEVKTNQTLYTKRMMKIITYTDAV